MHDLIVGWSLDSTITDIEIAGRGDFADKFGNDSSGDRQFHLWIWRADADGGDPSEVHIAGRRQQSEHIRCGGGSDGWRYCWAVACERGYAECGDAIRRDSEGGIDAPATWHLPNAPARSNRLAAGCCRPRPACAMLTWWRLTRRTGC